MNSVTHWTTAEGISIPIDAMEDTHLFNALAFCVRRKSQASHIGLSRLSRSFDPSIDALYQECVRREMDALGGGLARLLEGVMREEGGFA